MSRHATAFRGVDANGLKAGEGGSSFSPRVVLVTGLPYVKALGGARGELKRQISSFVRHVLRLAGTVQTEAEPVDAPPPPVTDEAEQQEPATEKGDEKGFRFSTSVNEHGRVEEVAPIIFSSQKFAKAFMDTYQGLPQMDPEMAATNQISIPFTFDGAELRFSYGAGELRDHHFPSLDFRLRRRMQLDPTATFSVTPERWASRMAKLLRLILTPTPVHNVGSTEAAKLVVLDAMACIGGNTLGFLRYFDRTLAMEKDPLRADCLLANLSLFREQFPYPTKSVEVNCGCFLEWFRHVQNSAAPTPVGRPQYDVLFLDPPWGGPDYADKIKAAGGDIFLDGEAKERSGGGTALTSVGKLVLQLVGSNLFQVVAVKLPTEGYNLEESIVLPLLGLASSASTTDNSPGEFRFQVPHSVERDFPFLFQFGHKTQLLVIACNSCRWNPDILSDSALFLNRTLDATVQRIMQWHNSYDVQADDGCHEHRPSFYDYDKKRWILLKKWLGTKEPASVAVW
jgi:hypothetical protein